MASSVRYWPRFPGCHTCPWVTQTRLSPRRPPCSAQGAGAALATPHTPEALHADSDLPRLAQADSGPGTGALPPGPPGGDHPIPPAIQSLPRPQGGWDVVQRSRGLGGQPSLCAPGATTPQVGRTGVPAEPSPGGSHPLLRSMSGDLKKY